MPEPQPLAAGPETVWAVESYVAATVEGDPIPLGEVDRHAFGRYFSRFQEVYSARFQSLDILIGERLLAQEAARRGINVAELLAVEVDAKVPRVSDADVLAHIQETTPAFDSAVPAERAAPIRQLLAERRRVATQGALTKRLHDRADVRRYLEPPRMPFRIAMNDPTLGPPDAPVTLVEYADFQ